MENEGEVVVTLTGSVTSGAVAVTMYRLLEYACDGMAERPALRVSYGL